MLILNLHHLIKTHYNVLADQVINIEMMQNVVYGASTSQTTSSHLINFADNEYEVINDDIKVNAVGIKTTPNEVYGVSSDGIETTPNEVYGVSTDGIETTPNEVYGYGISTDVIETTPNEVYGVGSDGIETEV